MPQLEDITYSRTATIKAITDYYHFLTTMYLKESQIIYLPPEGWPSIINANPEILQSLSKSDEVLALLAHLPYIWDEDDAQAADDCRLDAEHVRLVTEGPSFCQFVAPQAFSLTRGGRDTPVMLLDTRRGIIHCEDCPSNIERSHCKDSGFFDEPDESDESGDEIDKGEVAWRESAKAWAIPYFFEVLKDQFSELHWIPVSSYSVHGTLSLVGTGTEGLIPMLQDIHRQHGWPDLAVYRKFECLEAVRKALVENYPDQYLVR